MLKFVFPLGAIGFIIVTLSTFTNLLPSVGDVKKTSVESREKEAADSPKLDWVGILKRVPQYYEDPEKIKVVDKPVAKEKKVPKRKPIEATLVAIILEHSAESSAGVFLLPSEAQPITLKLGEGWLEPWELKRIDADFVVWVNREDNSELVHTLF